MEYSFAFGFLYICMYVCIYVCTCICTYIYICICICDSLWAVCSRENDSCICHQVFSYLECVFFDVMKSKLNFYQSIES